MQIYLILGLCVLLLITLLAVILRYSRRVGPTSTVIFVEDGKTTTETFLDGRPDINVMLLTPNSYSRPQTATDKITGIVIHYTANPGSGAEANRDYFESLKDSHETSASSHFIVGLEGEVIQCIPTGEVAYASNERNHDTVSIEVCHPDETGKFNDATYSTLVQLTGWLCEYLDVTPDDVIRHYDVTGKICPKYFVEHEDAWEQFIEDVRTWVKKNGG